MKIENVIASLNTQSHFVCTLEIDSVRNTYFFPNNFQNISQSLLGSMVSSDNFSE